MPSAPSRRRVLRLAGTALSASLAGCAGRGDRPGRLTVTPAPVPSDEPTPTGRPPDAGPPPSADAIRLAVSVTAGFSETSPARLEITFHNVGLRPLTALDGPAHVLPFVDDDYAGADEAGDLGLFLVPDDADLTISPGGGKPAPVEAALPTAPTDGCWSLPFDWPAARDGRPAVLHAVTVRPGRTLHHGYRLYFIDECTAGRFTFVNTFDLAAGDPPHERDLHRARLAFDVVVDESMALDVRVREPEVERPPDDG